MCKVFVELCERFVYFLKNREYKCGFLFATKVDETLKFFDFDPLFKLEKILPFLRKNSFSQKLNNMFLAREFIYTVDVQNKQVRRHWSAVRVLQVRLRVHVGR